MGPGADRNLSEKGRVLSADYVKDRIKPACHSGLVTIADCGFDQGASSQKSAVYLCK
jgi:hypothetical protein